MCCPFFNFKWLVEYERREEYREEKKARQERVRYQQEHVIYQASIYENTREEIDQPSIRQAPEDDIPESIKPKPKRQRHEETSSSSTNDNVSEEVDHIIPADPNAFSSLFIDRRQQAINNRQYRSIIQQWNPTSLQQLAKTIQSFAQGKLILDQHWIIFYWIAYNITYDTVSYFSKNYADQTAEGVFRNRKGVCAGYANLYKYLCDALQLPCEVVSGYAKGYGFDTRKGVPTDTDHAWNAVQIDDHWYLLDSTWGAGHLNNESNFVKELTPFYFLTRPSQMIYNHLPENDKWQLLKTPITMAQYLQMPKTKSTYFDLNLEIIHPRHQAHLTLAQNQSYASVHIRAPTDVSLMASLKIKKGQEVEGGHQVYFDRIQSIWKCKFAPNQIGSYEATIYAKKNTDAGTLPQVVSFPMEVTNLPSSLISFPETKQIFHDFNLQIIAPKNSGSVHWPKNASYVEILMHAPDNVQLTCKIEYNGSYVENGALAQFDETRQLWQLLFAPENTGKHELLVFAKISDQENSEFAVRFYLNVTELRNKMKFPCIYGIFHAHKCRIYEPLNGILKKGAQVPIHLLIPGATEVDVQVDSVWAKTKSYQDPIFNEVITVGSQDVTIYAKYNQGNSYSSIAKYSVQ